MNSRSRSGLLASPTKTFKNNLQKPKPCFKAITGPAPFIIKPFAGLYNPYSRGCSLFCNHPANSGAKRMIQNAKTNRGNERNYILPDDVAAIKAELEQLHIHDKKSLDADNIPEELFRKYTETDSRPLTPAPTLVSAHTRASASRRCLTPDIIFTSEIKEKTLLILDLRRSHSQETLSWYGGNNAIVENLTSSVTEVKEIENKEIDNIFLDVPESEVTVPDENQDEEHEFIKRRGKKRRRKISSRPTIFPIPGDPETLVAGITDSVNQSRKASLDPEKHQLGDRLKTKLENERRSSELNVNSFLDYDILRSLRRELTAEIVESEFGYEKRKALEEALKTVPKIRIDCDELIDLRKELNLEGLHGDLLLSLPRMFKRNAVRFELPMDSRVLNTMVPLTYLNEYVVLNSTRKMLYNFIFNLYKINAVEEETKREIYGNLLPEALGAMMGRAFTDSQLKFLQEFVTWDEKQRYSFKVFCGLSAFSERVLAKDFYPALPDKREDPCNQLEIVDFESLERKLHGKSADGRLVKMLRLIKES